MDTTLRKRLQAVIYVALRVAPKRVKQALVEREALKADAATADLSAAVTAAVLRGYDVSPKPAEDVGGGALYRGPGGLDDDST